MLHRHRKAFIKQVHACVVVRVGDARSLLSPGAHKQRKCYIALAHRVRCMWASEKKLQRMSACVRQLLSMLSQLPEHVAVYMLHVALRLCVPTKIAVIFCVVLHSSLCTLHGC